MTRFPFVRIPSTFGSRLKPGWAAADPVGFTKAARGLVTSLTVSLAGRAAAAPVPLEAELTGLAIGGLFVVEARFATTFVLLAIGPELL